MDALALIQRAAANAAATVKFHDPIAVTAKDETLVPRTVIAPVEPLPSAPQIKVAHGLVAGTFFLTFNERIEREAFDARLAALKARVPGIRFVPAKRGRKAHPAGHSVPVGSRAALIAVLRDHCAGQTCEGPEGRVTIIGAPKAPESSVQRRAEAAPVYPFAAGEERDAARELAMETAEREALASDPGEGEDDVDAEEERAQWERGFGPVVESWRANQGKGRAA